MIATASPDGSTYYVPTGNDHVLLRLAPSLKTKTVHARGYYYKLQLLMIYNR